MTKNITIGVRLSLGFSVVLALLVAMVAVALINFRIVESHLQEITENDFLQLELCNTMEKAILRVSHHMDTLLLTSNPEDQETETGGINTEQENYNQAWNELQKMSTNDPKEEALRVQVQRMAQTTQPFEDQIVQLALANKNAEAVNVMNTVTDPVMGKWIQVLNDLVQIQKERANTARDETVRAYRTALWLLLFLAMTAIALGILAAWFIARSITKPINKIVNGLNESAQQVVAASNQLSASAQQLSQGSAEQASSLEETSSTMQESASMLQQNTANTSQAAGLSKQATQSAGKGGTEMQEVMRSMQEIKKSSDQIAKIIKVIDDIAFQTNILALNAAIEAARAGEAGMGFAVVADEVRNLAQRSAQAAKDTTAIIETNIELSGKGMAVAERAREALNEINTQANKVNELMEEIAAAGQEQTQGVEQVNKALIQVETVTQQNAASAEESASAAEELNAQADSLRQIVLELWRLVHGKAKASQVGLKSDNHGINHFNYSDQAAIGQTLQTDGYLDTAKQNSNSNLPTVKEGNKTRVVTPEDVIPLEKDPDQF
jgi:methyl-accepting chemotaxis protein